MLVSRLAIKEMSQSRAVEQKDTSALKSSLLALANKGQEIGLLIAANYRFCLQVLQPLIAVPLQNMSRNADNNL